MQQYDDRIWELITKELSGEASASERKELRQWLDEDPDHQSFFKEIKKDWGQEPENIKEVGNTPYLFDYESGLSRLRKKLEKEEIKHPELPVSFQSQKRVAWKIAASIVFLVVSLSGYMTLKHYSPPVTTYTTSQVEQRIITLPDRSKVRLNKDSKLSFAEGFKGSTREINLQGEAFFDVTRNPARPFIIHVDDAVVKVLGTSFNVKDYGDETDDRLMVAVKDGVVSVRRQNVAENDSTAKITAGHVGVLQQNAQEVDIEATNIENYLSWMNGHLAFDGMSFDEVIKQLERIYDIDCELQSPSLAKLKLTVHTEKIQQDEVLKNIAMALNLTYRKQGNKVIWSKSIEGR